MKRAGLLGETGVGAIFARSHAVQHDWCEARLPLPLTLIKGFPEALLLRRSCGLLRGRGRRGGGRSADCREAAAGGKDENRGENYYERGIAHLKLSFWNICSRKTCHYSVFRQQTLCIELTLF